MSTFPNPSDRPLAVADSETASRGGASALQVANLMPFLHAEEGHGDRQAREAVFLTFNASLNFFESRLLGLCQAAGARITVIADAGVWAPDSRGARHAGRSYHLGLVQAPRAFHPKMLVLAGPRRALVGVGSGNLTMGGWQYNAEVLTAFTGDRQAVPEVLTDIAATLNALCDEESLDAFARGALARAAGELTSLISSSTVEKTGHRILTSLGGSILGQLPVPRAPVDELLISAPFHDPQAAAVRALVDRFKPAVLKIAIQPGWTVVNADALANVVFSAAADGTRTEILQDRENQADGGRYRHGKLIEWSSGGQRWAVTGSPNLSAAALLRGRGSGGNHEVAVLAPLSRSLFPEGVPIGIDQVPTVQIKATTSSEDGSTPGPTLMAAIKQPDGLHVHLSAPASIDASVEISAIRDEPDTWYEVGKVSAGSQVQVLEQLTWRRSNPDAPETDVGELHEANTSSAASLSGGSRCRLRWDDLSVPTGSRVGTLVYVSDPTLVMRRVTAEQVARTSAYRPRDLLGPDLQILSTLRSELEVLARDIAATRGPAVTRREDGEDHPDHVGPHEAASDSDVEPWLWVQDEALRHLGPGLAAFSLGLPSLSRAMGDGAEAHLRWLDQLTDETTAGEEGDTADDLDRETIGTTGSEEVADEGGPETAPGAGEIDEVPDHSADDLAVKTQRRRWCVKASDLAPDLPVASRLLILRLTLAFWSSGNWDEGDLEPARLVGGLLRSVDTPGVPAELEQRIGSLAAIAITMLRDRVDHETHNEGSLLYRQIVGDEGHLTIAADPELIEEFVRYQKTRTGFPLMSESVQMTIADIGESDDLADVIDTLVREGYEVSRPGPHLLQVNGDFSNPRHVALHAVGMAEDIDVVGVWAINDVGRWEFIAWRKPDLVTVQPRPGTDLLRWRHQVLNGMVGPAALWSDRFTTEGFPYERKHERRDQPFAEALDLLDRLGIVSARPTP